MKQFYSHSIKSLFVGGGILLGTTLSAQVYEITIGAAISANSVSNNGIVSLSAADGNLMWNKDSGVEAINVIANDYIIPSPAKITSDGSKIVGSVTNPDNSTNEIGIYDLATSTWTYLGGMGFSSDGASSLGWAISDDASTAVGLAWVNASNVHAVKWTAANGMVDLGSLTNTGNSRANAINQDGTVIVGWDDGNFGLRQGVIWKNGQIIQIADADGYVVSEAEEVSDDGQWVVGQNYQYQAWIWSEATGLTAISHPNAGQEFPGVATNISGDGSKVIGYYRPWSEPPYMGEGFIWTQEAGRITLNDYVDGLGIDRQGISLNLPLGISQDGNFISGNGINANGELVSFMIDFRGSMNTNDLDASKITYYPNPVLDVLNITTKDAIKTIEIYNLAGQKVVSTSNIQNGKLNLSNLVSGTYLVKVSFENKKSESFKMIKK